MTTDAVGGVWVYATELARALCGGGYEVTLVVMGPAPRDDQVQPLRNIPRMKVEVTDLSLEWMDPEATGLSRARDTLLRIAERVQPDLVHLNGYREAAFLWEAPVLVVAHSCVSSWWQACRGGAPSEARWVTYAAAVESALMAADAWVAPTAAFRDTMTAMYRPRSRGRVIWNGIDIPSASVPKQPFILAGGRLWDEAKNLGGLTRVASQLDWPVRLAGPAREPGAHAAQRAIGSVEWMGTLSRSVLLEQMQCASIFAAPAFYEPFGLSVLEAAASGCALVLADIPTFRELWTDAAVFVDPRSDDALRTALQTLCADDHWREGMQREARVRACRYSLTRMAEAYRDLYDELHVSGTSGMASRSTTLPELRA